MGIEMLHDDERHPRPQRQMFEQFGGRFEPSGRAADSDDRTKREGFVYPIRRRFARSRSARLLPLLPGRGGALFFHSGWRHNSIITYGLGAFKLRFFSKGSCPSWLRLISSL